LSVTDNRLAGFVCHKVPFRDMKVVLCATREAKLKSRLGIKRVVMVGDRGTTAR